MSASVDGSTSDQDHDIDDDASDADIATITQQALRRDAGTRVTAVPVRRSMRSPAESVLARASSKQRNL